MLFIVVLFTSLCFPLLLYQSAINVDRKRHVTPSGSQKQVLCKETGITSVATLAALDAINGGISPLNLRHREGARAWAYICRLAGKFGRWGGITNISF